MGFIQKAFPLSGIGLAASALKKGPKLSPPVMGRPDLQGVPQPSQGRSLLTRRNY